MSAAGLNEQALAAAQTRFGRWNLMFWGFVLLIPLGVILPCVAGIVAYRVAGDEYSAPIVLSAFVWPIFGVAGALLVRGARARAKRSLALVQFAESFGLRFEPRPAKEKYAFIKDVSFMAEPHTQSVTNYLEGTAGRWPLVVFDYAYAYLWGTVSEIGEQTIATFLSGFDHLPPLGVIPISTMGKIENFFLGKGDTIAFPHEPSFSRCFAVVGDDEAAILRCLNRELIDLLLSDRLLTLIVEDGRLLVFRRLTYIRAEHFQAFLAQAHRVAELLSA
jgi:hypothetical protein